MHQISINNNPTHKVPTYHNISLLREIVCRQPILLLIIMVHRAIMSQDKAVCVSAQRHLIKIYFLRSNTDSPHSCTWTSFGIYVTKTEIFIESRNLWSFSMCKCLFSSKQIFPVDYDRVAVVVLVLSVM